MGPGTSIHDMLGTTLGSSPYELFLFAQQPCKVLYPCCRKESFSSVIHVKSQS